MNLMRNTGVVFRPLPIGIKRRVPDSSKSHYKTNTMSELRETLLDELKDIYDAENQLLEALPKMAQAAKSEELKAAFEEHLDETENHIERLEKAFEIFGQEPKRKKCKAMAGLVEEGSEVIKEKQGDAALICAAQKVEHYEIASYGSLAAWAGLLEEDDAVELFEDTLNEEKAADEKLTEIAESTINAESEENEKSPKE